MKQMLLAAVAAVTVTTFLFAQGQQPPAGGRQGGPPQEPAAVAIPGQPSAADPFPDAIPANEGVIRVNVAEFAAVPDIDGVAARMMQLVDEPGTRRLFVNDMRGPLYTVSYDGRSVQLYVDINDPKWNVQVNSMGRERGFQHFAFHPQFAQQGTPGFGKFYTYSETSNMMPAPTFEAIGATTPPSNDAVLLEWTARTPTAAAYDGAAPRELMRWRDPFANHNGGFLSFNPLAAPNTPDFGMLYIGLGDGGSGGDPLNMSQNLGAAFGKIFRINPTGNNSRNKMYGIPADNPFVNRQGALAEIYAYGLRNPQRVAWDSRTGTMYISDIGQNIVEEVSPVPRGGNLGWNIWEGSYRFAGGRGAAGVRLENPRGDTGVVFPVVEYGQLDPLLQGQSAAGGLVVVRSNEIPALNNLLVFADMPSGEIFYVNVDRLPASGGQAAIRRILLNEGGTAKTLLDVIKAKNTAQGKMPATRADLRISRGPNNQIFLLNKGDGTIRVLRP
jgi:hypothetical protein